MRDDLPQDWRLIRAWIEFEEADPWDRDDALDRFQSEARQLASALVFEFGVFSSLTMCGRVAHAGPGGFAYSNDDGTWDVWPEYQTDLPPLALDVSEADAMLIVAGLADPEVAS